MEPLLSRFTAWRRDRRRQRNLRATARPGRALPRAGMALAAASVALAGLGGWGLWRHAERLAGEDAAGPAPQLAALQAAMPGLRFAVPDTPGVSVQGVAGGRLLVASGLHAGPALRVNLCTRPLPLQLGYRFSEVATAPALRHALLVGEDSGVPAMTIAAAGDVLRVRWRERGAAVQWTADAPGAAMRTLGWLTWRDGAVRVERRPAQGCAQGEMLVQAFSSKASGRGGAANERAYVTAFPAGGTALALRLAPGRYAVPAHALAPREDEVLFRRLQARGLLRQGADGLLQLAPPDLAQWLAADDALRAGELAPWRGLRPDEDMGRLLKRLYRQADGDYVRSQVDLYNSERRLLAWRLGSTAAPGTSVALQGAGGGELAQSAHMPALAVRLFADLPQGWQPWGRAAHWLGRGEAALVLRLPRPASGKERIDLLLAGRLGAAGSVTGAQLQAADACTGPACRSAGDVLALSLRPHAGALRIVLPVRALDVSAALHAGDQAYRHIRPVGGVPAWHAISAAGYAGAGRAAAGNGAGGAGRVIADREGTLLWSDGAPTPGARHAGLATLLGLEPGHASSLAGMLARAEALEGRAGAARLTISLPLQALGQSILECQGLRGGSWSANGCLGGTAAPPQRRAGLLLLDADNGDILLAAGAGAPGVGAGNLREARDFDRANPARSALRLPAWQHDGGAHSSPGSAFKVVSALGLEMAARHDRVLDGLLGGLPLPDIDRIAQLRGYGFETGAASYPSATAAAHVTNYREQSMARRAEAGRLGLAQAMTYSVNTWFAWTAELSDRTLMGQAAGGAPGLRALEEGALAAQRPIAEAARMLGFGASMRLDGGLLPPGFGWQPYDALQASAAGIDPIDSRHELRQMAIGLRMQATPLQMAVVAGAVGSGRVPVPRLLLALGAREADAAQGAPLPVRLDRIRKGMKGVIDSGTAAGAFSGPALAGVRSGLYGKTGTAPVSDDAATVWFAGWLEPGSLPGQTRRLAFAAFVSHSQRTGGAHAAPIVAALLQALAAPNAEQKGNPPSFAANGWAGSMPR
jgi:cell division protein FtsI/penicillin-binding protein 2